MTEAKYDDRQSQTPDSTKLKAVGKLQMLYSETKQKYPSENLAKTVLACKRSCKHSKL